MKNLLNGNLNSEAGIDASFFAARYTAFILDIFRKDEKRAMQFRFLHFTETLSLFAARDMHVHAGTIEHRTLER